jgi:hypothetical protein
MNISKNELLELLNGIEKSTFVHLLTETKVRMNKTGNPFFDKVIKKSSCNYLMGNDYEKRVITNGENEGIPSEENTFEVEEMKGKKHVSKVVCVDTKTESVYYLMVERFDEIQPKVEYTFEGNPIEKQLFESYMVKVSESKKQPQERKVKVLTFKLDNIKEISFGKQKYQVVE